MRERNCLLAVQAQREALRASWEEQIRAKEDAKRKEKEKKRRWEEEEERRVASLVAEHGAAIPPPQAPHLLSSTL